MELDTSFPLYKSEFIITSGKEKARHCLLKVPLIFWKKKGEGSVYVKAECHREKKYCIIYVCNLHQLLEMLT